MISAFKNFWKAGGFAGIEEATKYASTSVLSSIPASSSYNQR